MTDPFSWLPRAEDADQGEARDAIEQNEAMLDEAARMQKEAARLFYDVFTTGRGPELLALMRDCTIELDLMNISGTIGNGSREVPVNPAEWAFHRNGQNSVVRWIEQMVRIAATIESEGKDNV